MANIEFMRPFHDVPKPRDDVPSSCFGKHSIDRIYIDVHRIRKLDFRCCSRENPWAHVFVWICDVQALKLVSETASNAVPFANHPLDY